MSPHNVSVSGLFRNYGYFPVHNYSLYSERHNVISIKISTYISRFQAFKKHWVSTCRRQLICLRSH